jgi:hypothetical protein
VKIFFGLEIPIFINVTMYGEKRLTLYPTNSRDRTPKIAKKNLLLAR